MTNEDLEAIRLRNEERKAQFMPEAWGADSGIRNAGADIDTLLAEVERLRHKADECECGWMSNDAGGWISAYCKWALEELQRQHGPGVRV